MSDKRNVNVLVKDEYVSRIDDVAASLTAKGMRVTGILKKVGVISGEIEADKAHFESVNGVETVSASQSTQAI